MARVTAHGTLLALVCAGLLVACKAKPPEGIFACDRDADCPSGQSCRADGYCYGKGSGPAAHGDAGMDGSTPEPKGGDMDATTSMRDASSDGGPLADSGAAIFASGDPCSDSAALGCAANDSPVSVACVDETWTRADICSAHQRCDTRVGATQGQCLDLVPECEGKRPGDEFCRGNDRGRCGPDRVTFDSEPCPDGDVCALDGGVPSCVPDTDECALGFDDCDDDPEACVNTLGSYECACPQYYTGEGKGADGCQDALECASNNGGCDTSPMATCNEAAGAAPTCTCPDGYEGLGLGRNGCTDSDECAPGAVAVCGTGAKDCVNTDGSYRCVCTLAYALDADGMHCHARAWGTAMLLETDNAGNARNPGVAAVPGGDVFAVWSQSNGTRMVINAARHTPSGGWSAIAQIDTDSNGDSDLPQVAVDTDGGAVVVWRQSDGTHTSIWANRYLTASGWDAPRRISDGSSNADAARVAVSATGDAAVVWQYYDGTRYDVWAGRSGTHGLWSWAVAHLDTLDTDARNPTVTWDGAGNAFALWQQSDGTRDNIWGSRFVPASGWSTAALIENDSSYSFGVPSLAADASGNAIAVWAAFGIVSSGNVWSSRYDPASGWTSAAAINMLSAPNGRATTLGLDSAGNAIALWMQCGAQNCASSSIWASRYVPGSGWGTSASIDSSGGPETPPALAVDADGNALAAWVYASQVVVANRYTAGQGWDAMPTQLTGDKGGEVSVAIDGAGNGTAAWSQSDGARFNIWFNRYE